MNNFNFISMILATFAMSFCTILSNQPNNDIDSSAVINFNPSDLVDIVGLPFLHEESLCYCINDSNTKGARVGTARFKNSNLKVGYQELVVWYWDSKHGFHVIASQSHLQNAYKKQSNLFQFYNFSINENGEIAGSFMIDQITDGKNSYNQWAWLWWSMQEGLHLSELPSQAEIVKGITDDGYIVLEHNNSYEFSINIVNIHIKNHKQTFDFRVPDELPISFINELKDIYCKLHGTVRKNVNIRFRSYPFSINDFDITHEKLEISGHSTFQVYLNLNYGINYESWEIDMDYKIKDNKMIFTARRIRDKESQKSLCNNHLIFEK